MVLPLAVAVTSRSSEIKPTQTNTSTQAVTITVAIEKRSVKPGLSVDVVMVICSIESAVTIFTESVLGIVDLVFIEVEDTSLGLLVTTSSAVISASVMSKTGKEPLNLTLGRSPA